MATTATPSASRRLAMTDVTNIEKNAPRQTKPSRTPARKVSLCGKATETPELFFDTTEAPNVTPSEAPAFACTPHAAPRRSTTPVLATPDERLLTNAAAEEALTAAWIAAQTAEIEALRAQLRRGEFAPLREWLREHVHLAGSLDASANALARRVCGEPLSPEPFLAYLEQKYARIYEL